MKAMNVKKFSAKVVTVYIVLLVVFFFVAGNNIHFVTETTGMLSLKMACPSLQAGQSLTQCYKAAYDRIDSIAFLPGTYGRQNTDVIHFSVRDDAGTIFLEKDLDTATMVDLTPYTIWMDGMLDHIKGKTLLFTFTSLAGNAENGIGYGYGDSGATIHGSIQQNIPEQELACIDGQMLDGKLCFDVTGTDYCLLGRYYWQLGIILLIVIAALLAYLQYCENHNKKFFLRTLLYVERDYGFLIKQMVARDFKTKYKRSALGALWSFLNPLLTMGVQYFVFSTIFSNNIENYPIYLMIGIVCYNFFNEAVSMCLSSIIGNASLITKVYIPKYIFPFSRALSSGINLLLSLVPLIVFLGLTRTPVRLSWLLAPFALVCLFAFSLGLGLIMATLMVFFRDTQFLWGVASMLWIYLTPIFYSADIIPAQYMTIYKLNPLFHIIRFMRTCLINGISPEPQAYFFCIIMSFGMLGIGAIIFKKNQDAFVLNI